MEQIPFVNSIPRLFSKARMAMLVVFMAMGTLPALAQTTITTTGTNYTAANSGGAPGAVTFAVQNTNTNAVILSQVASFLYSSDAASVFTLWYHPTQLTGAPTISTANGWIQVATGSSVAPPAVNGIATVLSGMTFTIPGNTTYRMALTSASSTLHYSGASPVPSPSIHSAAGVNLLVGDNTTSPGYAGTTPTPINSPRWFTGSITFLPATPCSGTPAGGTATANPATPCQGSTSTLSLSGATLGTGLAYQWEYFDVPTSTWQNVIGGLGATTPTYTTPPVTASTTYRVKITCTNATSNPTAYSTSVTVAPLGNALPYTQTFEGITADNQLPPCMSATSINPYVLTYTANQTTYNRINHTIGGSKFASFRYGSNDWLFTPGLQLASGATYQISFWYITDGLAGWTEIKAGVGTSATPVAMTTVGTPVTNPNNTTYQQYIGTFVAPSAGIYNFGIFVSGSTAPWYVTVDDINIVNLPPCAGTPTGGTTVASTTTPCAGDAVQLGLSGNTVASGLSYQWEYFNVATSTWQNVIGGIGATTAFYTTGPSATTTTYRARITCAASPSTPGYSSSVVITPTLGTLPYTQTFESITADNQLPPCMSATSINPYVLTYIANQTTYNRTNHTPAGSKFASFRYGSNDWLFTPGFQLAGGTTYQMSFWYITDGLSGWNEIRAGVGNSPTAAAMTTTIGTPVPGPGNTTYQQYVGTFVAPANGVYNFGIFVNGSTSPWYVTVDDINIISLPPCTGAPTAGTITPGGPVLFCTGNSYQLSTTGGSLNSGLTYQWQESPGVGAAWAPAAGTGATTPFFTTPNLTDTILYRLIVTCTQSGLRDTTAPVTFNTAPFYFCYCPSFPTTPGTFADIGNVTIERGSNAAVQFSNGVATPNTNNTTATNGYSNFTNLPPIVVYRDTLYRYIIRQISFTTLSASQVAVFLDMNRNGIYESTERIISGGTSASTTPAWAVNDTFRIPDTAVLGITGMRVILRQGTTPPDPCNSYTTYGETEDYLVNISYPPCNGPVNPGTAIISDTTICLGYALQLTDTTHERMRSGIVWDWQRSTTGGSSWTAIAASQGQDALTVLITQPQLFRLRMICTNTADTTYSNTVEVKQSLPYQCYCYSMAVGGTTGMRDSTDVGAFKLGTFTMNTSGPHLLNPAAIRGRTDYTNVAQVNLWAGTTYPVNIYHTMRATQHKDAKVTLFIDYNNNLQYDIPRERVLTGYTTANNWFWIGSVTIPADSIVTDLPTGMRLIINEDINPNVPSDAACGTYTSGETEDYVVILRNGSSTGIDAASLIRDLGLNPNPTTGRTVVTFNVSKPVKNLQLVVTDLTGRTLSRQAYPGTTNVFRAEVDLSGQARGVYFVEVQADGERLVRKLVVQ